jgi:hypothetical protein
MRAVKISRSIAVINLGKSVPLVLAQAKAIVAEIAANPSIFITPNPPLAVLNSQIAALEAAHTAALSRVSGAVEIRNVKLQDLTQSLHTTRTYVEGIANADPSNAPATIKAAGLLVKKARAHTKQELAVKQGAIPGTVTILAKSAGTRATYSWQWSLDDKAWTDLPQTLKARTSMVNLAVGVTHYFRFRVLDKAGLGEWSDAVSLMVK